MEEVKKEQPVVIRSRDLHILPALQKYYQLYLPEFYANFNSVLGDLLSKNDEKIILKDAMYTSATYRLERELLNIAFTVDLLLAERGTIEAMKLADEKDVKKFDAQHQQKLMALFDEHLAKSKVAYEDRDHSPLDGSQFTAESRAAFHQEVLNLLTHILKIHQSFTLEKIVDIEGAIKDIDQKYQEYDELMYAIFKQKTKISMQHNKEMEPVKRLHDINRDNAVQLNTSVSTQLDRYQLHLACKLVNMDAVQALVKSYWLPHKRTRFINRYDLFGQTALHYVVMLNTDDCKTNDEKATRLDLQYQITKFLLDYYADPNLMNNEGYSPLHLACKFSSLAIVQLLIQYKANPNLAAVNINERDMKNPPGIEPGYLRRPIHFAAYNGKADILNLLIELKVDVNVTAENNKSPLHDACFNGHFDCVKQLVDGGAAIDVCSYDARTPLHAACLAGHVAIAKFLVEKGAKFDEKGVGSPQSLIQNLNKVHHQGMVDFLVERVNSVQVESVIADRDAELAKIDEQYRVREMIMVHELQERIRQAQAIAKYFVMKLTEKKAALLQAKIRKDNHVSLPEDADLPSVDPAYLSSPNERVKYFHYYLNSVVENIKWICQLADTRFEVSASQPPLYIESIENLIVKYLTEIDHKKSLRFNVQNNVLNIIFNSEEAKQLIKQCLEVTGILTSPAVSVTKDTYSSGLLNTSSFVDQIGQLAPNEVQSYHAEKDKEETDKSASNSSPALIGN